MPKKKEKEKPDLDRVYRNLIKWKSQPDDGTSIEVFCEKNKITIADYIALKERPEYPDDIRKETLAWMKLRIPELVHTIYDEVKKSRSTTDLERFFKIAYEIEKKDKDVDKAVFNQFNYLIDDEKYRKIVAREAKLLDGGSQE